MNSPTSSESFIKMEAGGRNFRITCDQPIKTRPKTLTEKAREENNKLKVEKKHLEHPEAKTDILPIEGQPNFHIPHDYAHCDNREAVLRNAVEYDVDNEDLVWLKCINPQRKQDKKSQITASILEQSIDMLEKESHFQVVKSGDPFRFKGLSLVDNDAPCCICQDEEDSNANQIIFCDMCNIAVHQECYGVPYIPEGQWLCRRCQLSPSTPVKCELCPFSTGAFKQTTDGRWVHVICAIYVAEVHFANVMFLEPVENIDLALKRRARLTCQVCNKKKVGACLQCSKRSCLRAFHVNCALHSGMKMEVREEKNRTTGNVTMHRFVFCHLHSETGEISNQAEWNRSVAEKMAKAKRMANISTREKHEISIPVVPQEKILEIANKVKIDQFDDIFYYWLQKRKSRFGVPLVRRLQVYHTQKNQGSHSNLEQSTTGDDITEGDMDPYMKYRKFRKSLEDMRMLSEMIKKREKHKLALVSCTESLMSSLRPASIIMRDTLEKLVEKDHQNVFTNPVSEEEVPGYHQIITNPMDFKTMREKLNRGEYSRMIDFKADFNLIIKNCAVFNRNNMYFWKYGHRISQIGQKIIKQAEASEGTLTNALLSDIKCIKLSDQTQLKSISEENRIIDVKLPEVSSRRQANKQRVSINNTNDTRFSSNKKRTPSVVLAVTSDVSPKEENNADARSINQIENYSSAKIKTGGVQSRKRKLVTHSHSKKVDGKKGGRSVVNGKKPFASFKVSSDSLRKNPLLIGATTQSHTLENNHNLLSDVNTNSALSMVKPRKMISCLDDVTATELSSDTCPTTSADEFALESLQTRPKRRKTVDGERKFPTSLSRKKQIVGPLENGKKQALQRRNHSLTNGNIKFQHNDLVWIPLDPAGKAMFPARVIDPQMRIFVPDFPFDKAAHNKPQDGGNYSLVILFDIIGTWKWVLTSKIRHCHFPTDPNYQPPAFISSTPGASDALAKAKKFWESVMNPKQKAETNFC